MKYRKVRIAFSVLCGIFCLLLVAMWMRSYSKNDDLRGMVGQRVFNVQSLRGELGIGLWAWQFRPIQWRVSSETVDESFERLWPPVKDKRPLSIIGIRWQKFPNDMTMFVIQFWALALVSAAIAATPWIFWRFRLRTLLIGMTLVAVVLGVAVATS
ncbi:MAG: hypothetical protein WD738_18095 [Pirellulales bacterium]